MLFETPQLTAREHEVLDELLAERERMRLYLHEPRRWHGSLRRQAFARAIQGSNSIEGYVATLDDAAAVAIGEEPMEADKETQLAIAAYRKP